jgi:hypothetical protein
MFEEVATYLVLAPIVGAILAGVALIGWVGRPRASAVAVKKEPRLSD